MKNISILCGFLALVGLPHPAQAQGGAKPDITVKDIKVKLLPAPAYSVSAQDRPSNQDQSRKWLKAEAELTCHVEYADEVMVKFYVVAVYGNAAKEKPADGHDILAATVTIVNMSKNVGTGKKNIVPVFMDANTVKKYGASATEAQFIPQVAVEVFYKGRRQDVQWMSNAQKGVEFWMNKQPRLGVLLNLVQSPWFPAYCEDYEQVKPSGLSPAM